MMRIAVPAFALLVLLLSACRPAIVPNDPIIARVRANDVDAVTAFIAEGGNVNMTDREGNPLLYLASGPKGGLAVASVLIEAGAVVDAVSSTGRRPLENAVSWCDVNMVQLLLFAGADPDPLGQGRAEDVACKAPADRRAMVLALIEKAVEDKNAL